MAKKRAADFDVRQAIGDPGFTPKASDAEALLALLAEGEDDARQAERALLKLGEGALGPALRAAASEEPGARAAALRFLGRLAGAVSDEAIGAALVRALDDEAARVRRAAAAALGRARPAGASEALAEALGREGDASARRAMIEALGKLGGEVAARAIEGGAGDPETAREHARASLMATRTDARAVPSRVLAESTAEEPTQVALYARAGLEDVLLGELSPDLRPRIVRDPPGGARVVVTLKGAPMDLYRAARTFHALTFPLDPVRFSGGDPTEAIVASLVSPKARAILARFTDGPLRFRLDFRGGGKRRAAVWRVASEVAARAPELVNDPTESPWQAEVHEGLGVVRVELRPAIDDPRFAYRQGDVPAASHPTIAAALARVAGAREDDVVWDPFVGSGTELIERAKLGGYWRLMGSDVDPRALAIARKNLEAAGVRDALLLEGDASKLCTPGPSPTLILSNPPLGRRVHRGSALAPLLDRFVAHAASVLAPSGRLVWMSPFPRRTEEMADRKGLALTLAREVDMGGFPAEMQVLVKR
jgi:predicted RNA methylase